ncbi:MAG: ATP synthase gamma chain [Candidatus Tyloplasma litorale]|nr:MAG: ATP synthase gamma chain [Mycoplasmatales bacterium]
MATLRQIKEQKKSVSTINKITKAMKLVSSAKSQKAIKKMREYKKYFRKIEEVMSEIVNESPISTENLKGTYWILIMSDLGLAGGYNNNILKQLKDNIEYDDNVLIIGNKGISYFKKHEGNTEFFPLEEMVSGGNLLFEITRKVKSMYYDHNKKVKIIYTEFENQVEFNPTIKTLLPIQKIELSASETKLEENKNNEPQAVVEYEPNKDLLLRELESLYIHSFLIGVYREAQASEHTSRKNAMENATNNGQELLEKLDIEYNRGRQAKITQEISEIIGGAESLK